jgi:hypothetical protein
MTSQRTALAAVLPIRRAFAVAVSIALVWSAVIPAAATGSVEWTRQFGTPGFDVARAMSANATGVYTFGTVSGALPGQSFAGGPGDVFLRKYDLAGNEIWTRQFGTSGDEFSGSGPVALDDGTVYVVGYTDGAFPGQTSAGDYDLFVRKYSEDGDEIWTRQFGTSGSDFADGIAVGRGGLFVAGSVHGALPGQVHGGSFDAFVRRYDYDGTEVWTRQFGGSGSEDFHAVAVDKSGIYVAGSVTTGPDFGGDGDGLVIKYGSDGSEAWVRTIGTQAGLEEHLGGIAVKRGNVYIGGYTFGTLPGQTSAGGRDAFVRTYDTDGNEVWTRQFGTVRNDGNALVAVAADGQSVYVASIVGGAFPGQTSAGSSDFFVRRYSVDGTVLSTAQFGSPGPDSAQAISVDDAAVYVAGRVGGALPGQTWAGDQDAFVMKLSKD